MARAVRPSRYPADRRPERIPRPAFAATRPAGRSAASSRTRARRRSGCTAASAGRACDYAGARKAQAACVRLGHARVLAGRPTRHGHALSARLSRRPWAPRAHRSCTYCVGRTRIRHAVGLSRSGRLPFGRSSPRLGRESPRHSALARARVALTCSTGCRRGVQQSASPTPVRARGGSCCSRWARLDLP